MAAPRAPEALRPAEARALARLDRTARRGRARLALRGGSLGVLGGLAFAAALRGLAGPGLQSTLGRDVPTLAALETALGPTGTLAAAAAVAFGGAFASLAWRLWPALMHRRAALRDRAAQAAG